MAPLVSSRAGGARGLVGGRAASAAASKPSHSGEATTIRRRSSATRASREEWGRHLGARSKDGLEALKQYACALCGAAVLIAGGPLPGALAEVRLPPLDTDPQRCERAFVGNTLGMANAVADKLLDLRFCDYKTKSALLREPSCNASPLLRSTCLTQMRLQSTLPAETLPNL